VAGEALVEVDGGGVLFDEFGHGLVKTAGPGFVVGGHDGVPWYEVGGDGVQAAFGGVSGPNCGYLTIYIAAFG